MGRGARERRQRERGGEKGMNKRGKGVRGIKEGREGVRGEEGEEKIWREDDKALWKPTKTITQSGLLWIYEYPPSLEKAGV